MLVSEAKIREKFYNQNRQNGAKQRSRKELKAMFTADRRKKEGVRASANVQRGSARKFNRVLDLIRGKALNEALAIVKFTPTRAARLIEKVMLSAKANAENTRNWDAENLIIHRAYVEQGPTIPRIRPMSMGRVGRIRKRTCSTYIVLTEKQQKQALTAKSGNETRKETAKKETN